MPPGTKCARWACSTASPSCARTIADWQPDIVFNLLEEFDGIVSYDQHVIAFLEMLRQPYTGCNPRGLLLSRDKALCKQVFAFHRISTPQFAVFRRGQRLHVPRKLRFPLFVKSTTDDASLGIAQASVVEDAARLRERIEFVLEQHKSDVLVEEYIEGRELYVGMLGNERLTRFPVWELNFGSMPDNRQRDRHPQGEVGSEVPRASYGIDSAPAQDLAAGRRAAARPAVAAHLSRAGTHRLRAHGFPDARRRQHLRARGQCESASGEGRGFRACGGGRGPRLPRPARSIVKLGLTYPATMAGDVWRLNAMLLLLGCCLWRCLRAAPTRKRRPCRVNALVAMLPGSYDNLAQSRASSEHPALRLMVVPVQAPLVGDHVFYVQEMAADDARRVLAQRLYVVEAPCRRREPAIMAQLDFNEPNRWRDGHLKRDLFRALLPAGPATACRLRPAVDAQRQADSTRRTIRSPAACRRARPARRCASSSASSSTPTDSRCSSSSAMPPAR